MMDTSRISEILDALDTWNANGEIPYSVYSWLHDQISSLDLFP